MSSDGRIGRRKAPRKPSTSNANGSCLAMTMDSDDMSTMLARQGSKFGLPIALQLALLMKGGVGIAEVGQCSFPFILYPWP